VTRDAVVGDETCGGNGVPVVPCEREQSVSRLNYASCPDPPFDGSPSYGRRGRASRRSWKKERRQRRKKGRKEQEKMKTMKNTIETKRNRKKQKKENKRKKKERKKRQKKKVYKRTWKELKPHINIVNMLQTRSRKTTPRQQVLAAGEQTFSWVSHDVPHETLRPPFSNTPHSYEYPTKHVHSPWNHHLCHHIAWQHVLVFHGFPILFPDLSPACVFALLAAVPPWALRRCGSEGKSQLNTLRSNQQRENE